MSDEAGTTTTTTAAPDASAEATETPQSGGARKAQTKGAAMLRGDSGKFAGKTEAPSPQQKERAGELSADDAEAIAEAVESSPANPGEETIKIGNVDVPLSALNELSPEVLKKIKRKVRANGTEMEVSLLEALESVPKSKDYIRKTQQLAQVRKQLEQIAQRMGGDTIGAYAALHGISRDEAVNDLLGQLQREPMTKEEKRQRELELRAAQAEEYERRDEERAQGIEKERLAKSYIESINGALTSAGLKPSQYLTQRVAMTMGQAMQDGELTNPGPDDFAHYAGVVAKEIAGERTETLGSEDEDGDALIARYGEKRAAKIARAYADKVRKAQKSPERPAGSAPRATSAPKKNETYKEYIERKNREMGVR